MEAPDKIYINGFSAFATEPVKDGTEYIRKEALLEWIVERKDYWNGNLPWERGYKKALEELKDKLESL